MSTPAELLMQLQETHSSNSESLSLMSSSVDATESDLTSTVNSDVEDEKSRIPATSVLAPSILDEAAFPMLGSATAAGTPGKLIWGSATVANGNGHKKAGPVMFRSSNVQESFTIDLDQQSAINKTELFKLTSALKKEYKVSIESTVSERTKKRTFLITGTEDAIKKVRREIIKKLTKPVSIEFTVPSKLRRVIIGPSGRTLTPIINATGVKIDIEKESSRAATPSTDATTEDEDDFFGTPVSVKINGDAEGAQTAKAMILAIVDEATKNISLKVDVLQKLRPFIKAEIESSVTVPEKVEISIPGVTEKSSKIFISGPREETIQLRDDINLSLEKLSSSLKTETKIIKKSFHRFIDPAIILEKASVLVEVPAAADPSSEISFTGKPEDIKKALDLTKEITDSYKMLSLEISRAHGGNVNHAKNLSAYFKYSGFLDQISNDLITVTVPSYSALLKDQLKSILIDISCGSGTEREQAEAVKKSIIAKVNQVAPYSVREITDIEPFVFSQLDSSAKEVAKSNNVTIVPLASLAGVGNTLLLVADPVETDFLPTQEEISQRIDAVDEALTQLRELSSNITSEVISVPSAEQKLIYGNNGSTLRTILSQFTKNGIEIKLNQNKTGDSENEILIKGFKTEVPQVIKNIQQVIEDIKNHEEAVKYNTTIPYSTKLISRLIGQKGAHLNSLKDKYDVRIDVDDHDEKDTETNIKLTGLKVNVDATIEEIKSESKKWADEKTSKLKIDSKYYKQLVGRNRVYAKRLEDKYKVSIWFPFDSPGQDEVVIRGPSKGVAKAEEELKELLKYEIENGYKTVIKVPVEILPRVIGKGGDVINGIATETGVEFRFTRDDLKEKELGHTEIEIVGSRSAIKAAEAKINLIKATVTEGIEVDPKYYRFLIGPSGSIKREIILNAGGSEEDNRLLQIPHEDSTSREITSTGDKAVVEAVLKQIKLIVLEKEKEVTELCDIPKNKHRLLIGPNGFIRKNLENEFKVTIIIPRQDSDSTSVSIRGAPENIEAAKLKIVDLTKDDWSAEIMVPASVHSAIAERGAFFRRLRNDLKVSVVHGPSSRIATKLSNSNIPQPPAEAFGDENEKSKWTFVDDSDDVEPEQTIPWRLKGDAAQVEKAQKIIQKLVDQSKTHDTTGYFYSANPALFSKIVGPQGRRVQELRERSGCFIVVPRIDDPVDNIIYVRGDKKGIEKVKNSFLTSLNREAQ